MFNLSIESGVSVDTAYRVHKEHVYIIHLGLIKSLSDYYKYIFEKTL